MKKYLCFFFQVLTKKMDASFKEERPPNPRATASIFNILTFG